MALSKSQQLVIDKMKEGWELGSSTMGRAWLQKNGLGRGGETMGVHRNTLHSLYKMGLIKHIYGFPTSHHTLVENL